MATVRRGAEYPWEAWAARQVRDTSNLSTLAEPTFRYKSGSVRVLEIFRYLIAPKSLHGINQSGAASRDVAGEKRHGNQN